MLKIIACAVCVMFWGCSSNVSKTRVQSRQQSIPVRQEAASADDYIAAIHAARTPAAEADAIRNLRKWEIANGFTYTIRNVRTDTNMPIDDPSATNVPVRSDVTIYRGREVVRSFSFFPRDNRNLALFGE
jgi:hypothetical protein